MAVGLKHLAPRAAGRGWSLEALVNASGVSRSTLSSQIEREEANPTLAVTLRIARAFGFSLGELLEMPGAASAAINHRHQQDCEHSIHVAERKSSVSAVPECTGVSKVREGGGGMADTLLLN